jgi:chromosome segregation ATPase
MDFYKLISQLFTVLLTFGPKTHTREQFMALVESIQRHVRDMHTALEECREALFNAEDKFMSEELRNKDLQEQIQEWDVSYNAVLTALDRCSRNVVSEQAKSEGLEIKNYKLCSKIEAAEIKLSQLAASNERLEEELESLRCGVRKNGI